MDKIAESRVLRVIYAIQPFGPQPMEVSWQTIKMIFRVLDFGTMGVQLNQSALTTMLHIYKVTLKNEHVTDGPKSANGPVKITTQTWQTKDQN